jgi:hypothetical protein
VYIIGNTQFFVLVLYHLLFCGKCMLVIFIHFLIRTMEFQVGKDVAQCLNEALARNGLNVRVTALVCCHLLLALCLNVCLLSFHSI